MDQGKYSISGIITPNENAEFLKYLQSLPNFGMNDISKISIKIIEPELIQKIKNITYTWNPNRSKNFRVPVYKHPEGGMLVNFHCSKLSWYIGPKMIEDKPNKKDWINKTFKIGFDIKKYSFKSDRENEGIQFIIKFLDLEI